MGDEDKLIVWLAGDICPVKMSRDWLRRAHQRLMRTSGGKDFGVADEAVDPATLRPAGRPLLLLAHRRRGNRHPYSCHRFPPGIRPPPRSASSYAGQYRL